MKLFHIFTTPASVGFLKRQASFLRAQGVAVHIVSSPGEGLEEFGNSEGVTTHAVEMARKISPLRDFTSIWELFMLFRAQRPGIVHAHTPKASLVAMIAARMAGVRCRIFHVHGLPHSTAAGFTRWALRWSTKVSSLLATRVLCVSRSVAELAVEDRLCRAPKVAVLGHGSINGVDSTGAFCPERYDPAQAKSAVGIQDSRRVIGFAGRLVRDKGICELYEAWTSLRDEFPDLQLAIAGEAELRDSLPERILLALKSDSRVRMLGHFSDMPNFYAAVDVVAFPTYREGLGMVPLEAAAMEVPAVASRCVGCVDAVVDGVTGTLVAPGDSAALADALRNYLNDPELRRRHGVNARERVLRDFRPEDVWEATLNEYRSAMGEGAGEMDQPDGAATVNERFLILSRLLAVAVLKRGLDVAVSSLTLALLAPLLAILAVLVRISMGSPVLFRHTRPGRHERPFTMLKFRTMRDERDASGKPLPDGERLTRLGRFLRRTSLDELPELWNVLKGDMSLVGPRPLLFEYVTYFNEEERRRALVRPGITGWAQIHGRNLCSWDERLARDVWYVENLSFGLDLRILWMTMRQVAGSKGVVEDPRSMMLNLDEERRLRGAKA